MIIKEKSQKETGVWFNPLPPDKPKSYPLAKRTARAYQPGDTGQYVWDEYSQGWQRIEGGDLDAATHRHLKAWQEDIAEEPSADRRFLVVPDGMEQHYPYYELRQATQLTDIRAIAHEWTVANIHQFRVCCGCGLIYQEKMALIDHHDSCPIYQRCMEIIWN